MSVSGLAITLSDRARDAETAVRALSAHPAIEVGPREGRRLAAAVETPSQRHDRDLWRWMVDLEGVQSIDVVFVHFDDDSEAPDDPGE